MTSDSLLNDFAFHIIRDWEIEDLGKAMHRKTSTLALCSGGLFVFVWTAGLTQRALGQEKPLWFPFNGKAWFLPGANYPGTMGIVVLT